MASSFIWYELMTSDLPAAEAFYKAVVGWTTEDFPGSDFRYVVAKAGERGVGGMMTLPEQAAAMGAKPCWLGYIHAADVDAATEAVRKAGGKVFQEPMDIPDVGRFSVVADPQGAVFMMMTPKGPDQPPAPMGTQGHIDWHELYAADGDTAFDFYAAQFGWTKDHDMDMGAMGVYRIFAIDGVAKGGIMTKPAQMPAPAWIFYFNVGAIDDAVSRVKGNGGQVINGPMEVPGGAWVVQCLDPQGAMFALVAPKR